jgi:hypothetical protein
VLLGIKFIQVIRNFDLFGSLACSVISAIIPHRVRARCRIDLLGDSGYYD